MLTLLRSRLFPRLSTRVSPRRSLAIVASLVASLTFIVPVALVLGATTIVSAESGLPRSESPEGAQLYFISPTDGATVSSPVVVRFGLGGMGVAPAGVEKGGTGHHHLVIDAELPKLDLPVPKSANYRHFGKGQTEVSLDLEPGKHTLQLILGDHLHIPHDPAVVSEQITIIVEDAS